MGAGEEKARPYRLGGGAFRDGFSDGGKEKARGWVRRLRVRMLLRRRVFRSGVDGSAARRCVRGTKC